MTRQPGIVLALAAVLSVTAPGVTRHARAQAAPLPAPVPAAASPGAAGASPAVLSPQLREALRGELIGRHGAAEAPRIERGLAQLARHWRPEDGDADALQAFVRAEFVPRGPALDVLFARLEFAFERIEGYMISLVRDLRRGSDLDLGPKQPIDNRLAGFDPAAHLQEDLYQTGLAFVALLNFPETTLAERTASAAGWSRRDWAEARLTDRVGLRVPAAVNQSIAAAGAAAGDYITSYNLRLHHILTDDGRRLFPRGKRLISHWNLRDEIKALYADKDKDGLVRQRLIQRAMERIVRQEIPSAVIDDPRWDWSPGTNTVRPAAVEPDPPVPDRPAPAPAEAAAREPDERYRFWLANFRAVRGADPYDPLYKDYVTRIFAREREIPEGEVRALFEAVLSSPLGAEVGRIVASRLGRPLEPFDIWYPGFSPGGARAESELDALTRKKYPNADAFAADLPRLLRDLGFTPERASFLAERIVVEPSRGAGHAFETARRDDKAHLRTRIGAGGMDYKGYNIAIHELGHNAEQVFSTVAIDHTLLRGVPNTAFTEALAFVFQERSLELLGLGKPSDADKPLEVLGDFWGTREIAAVALVDMGAWRWLYEHPDATPAEFRAAVVGLAQDVWNKYFAPLFGVRDVPLLGVYSHMISRTLYTPDYPIGRLIAFQVGEHFRTLQETTFGEEFERIAKLGRISPDAWMRGAVGAPLSAGPLLAATGDALNAVGKPPGPPRAEPAGDSQQYPAAVENAGSRSGVTFGRPVSATRTRSGGS